MAFNFSPKIATDGLLMCLDAGNTNSYTSGSTTWTDLSRGSKNGLLTNGPTFSSSNLGSIVFDGLDDYVRFTNSEGRVLGGSDWFPMSTSAFTFDTWIKSPGLASGRTVNGVISLTYGLTMNITSIGRVQTLVWDNLLSVSNYTSSVKTNMYDGSWHHIVASNDSLTSKIYIDGILDVSTSAPFYGDVKTIWYGSGCVLGHDVNNPPISRFNGNMGVFRMYNRALSATEVLQNYNTTKTRYI
jgi:hypothetical protein